VTEQYELNEIGNLLDSLQLAKQYVILCHEYYTASAMIAKAVDIQPLTKGLD